MEDAEEVMRHGKMDTFARLRKIIAEGPPGLSGDWHEDMRLVRVLWNERNQIAWGRALCLRIAVVGWALAIALAVSHVV